MGFEPARRPPSLGARVCDRSRLGCFALSLLPWGALSLGVTRSADSLIALIVIAFAAAGGGIVLGVRGFLRGGTLLQRCFELFSIVLGGTIWIGLWDLTKNVR